MPVERALGIVWDVETDFFAFKINVLHVMINKRGILSVFCSLYDPLGLLAPYILPAKIFLQQPSQKDVDIFFFYIFYP